MIFNPDDYNDKVAYLSTVTDRRKSSETLTSFVFQINPESISETLPSNIDSVQLINTNMPRRIFSGTKGREVTFTILLHGMLPLKFSSQPNSNKIDLRPELLTAARIATTLVPFGANVVRGINTVSDLLNIGLNDQGTYNPPITKDLAQNIDISIKELQKLQSGSNGYKAAQKVRIVGYPAFEHFDFYISNTQVNRKLWDKNLKTQFAEMTVTLVQIGSDNVIGKLS